MLSALAVTYVGTSGRLRGDHLDDRSDCVSAWPTGGESAGPALLAAASGTTAANLVPGAAPPWAAAVLENGCEPAVRLYSPGLAVMVVVGADGLDVGLGGGEKRRGEYDCRNRMHRRESCAVQTRQF